MRLLGRLAPAAIGLTLGYLAAQVQIGAQTSKMLRDYQYANVLRDDAIARNDPDTAEYYRKEAMYARLRIIEKGM